MIGPAAVTGCFALSWPDGWTVWTNLVTRLQHSLRRGDPALLWGCGLLLLTLIAGSRLFGAGSLPGGLLLTLALLKGEFLDTLAVLMEAIPTAVANLPLAYLSLLYAVVGTLLTALLVALILDRLLAQRPRAVARGGGVWRNA